MNQHFIKSLLLRSQRMVVPEVPLAENASRVSARLQRLRHGHFIVNGRRVNIPSYLVRTGDVVEVREKSRTIARVVEALGAVERRGVPRWIELDKEAFKGTVSQLPTREDVTLPIREQLIIELYSK